MLGAKYILQVREVAEAQTSTGQIIWGALFCFFKNVGVELPMRRHFEESLTGLGGASRVCVLVLAYYMTSSSCVVFYGAKESFSKVSKSKEDRRKDEIARL